MSCCKALTSEVSVRYAWKVAVRSVSDVAMVTNCKSKQWHIFSKLTKSLWKIPSVTCKVGGHT